MTDALDGADAVIVIFGAAVRPDGSASTALRHRVQAAATFGAARSAPVFLPTGAVGRYGPSEASVMAALLRDYGVPAERIILEETGTDTLSSVRAVVRLCRFKHTAVFAATSAYHLPRCLLLLRLGGIPAHRCPPWSAPAASTLWKRWYWRLREVPAIPFDAALTIGARLLGRWP